MLIWEEKLNLGNGKYILKDAKITDTQHLMLVKNSVCKDNPIYVEYCEQDAQTKRFYLTATTIEEAEKEVTDVIYKFLQGEAHMWLKRLNRFKETIFSDGGKENVGMDK